MTTGIICEFNPFHKGHKYLIDCVKKDGDSVVCVMSGNYVQRGEPAVYDKFTRAKEAVKNGADLVIELPCVYSTKSAEGFAKYGVRLLEATGVVDRIAFGTESDDIDKLRELSGKIKSYDSEIKEKMKSGISYPAARQQVLKSDLLEGANNILALEYLAQTKLDSIAVKRIGQGHDSADGLYSAMAIRNTLSTDEIHSLKNCERAVLAKLRTMTAEDFLKIEDVSDGLENRICDAVSKAAGIDELYDLIKTKRFTHSRIRRIILRAYLGITEDYSFEPPYLRVLAFNGKGRQLLCSMKEKALLPVISRYSDATELGGNAKKLMELECRCTDLYNLSGKKILPCGEEQRSSIFITD
ncbi:MAG: nucleotidyltransferase family protein [Eubacterium sp.]|nr:nucleotidyltransferase family protein [Eubacterium sp.]